MYFFSAHAVNSRLRKFQVNVSILNFTVSAVTEAQNKTIMANRPFPGSGHMVRNKLRWDANDAVGLRNKGKCPTFLCFEVPLRHLRPSVIYSVPCDRILQRAYCKRTG